MSDRVSLLFVGLFFFFKQKTAYEMRISDWSSDVCPADGPRRPRPRLLFSGLSERRNPHSRKGVVVCDVQTPPSLHGAPGARSAFHRHGAWFPSPRRSEERRVGNESVSTCRSRWSRYHTKKNNISITLLLFYK